MGSLSLLSDSSLTLHNLPVHSGSKLLKLSEDPVAALLDPVAALLGGEAAPCAPLVAKQPLAARRS